MSCVLLDAGYLDEYNVVPHRVPFCSEQLAGPDLSADSVPYLCEPALQGAHRALCDLPSGPGRESRDTNAASSRTVDAVAQNE
jgi:hypothetical protein